MTTDISVISSILDPTYLVENVLPGFGLNDVSECKFYSGGFNHTHQIRTAQGSTYYLRAYRRQWRRLDDILYELDLLNHLRHKRFPAARPVSHKDGQFFYTVPAPEGTRYLALFTEAPGTEISYEYEPEKIASHYGRAEAHMHNALDDFYSLHPRFHKDIEHFIDNPLRNIEPFLYNRPDDWSYILQYAEKLRQRIIALPASKLEQGACHGDLQGYHANLVEDGNLTFYDFDCCGYGYRAYDLAVFLWCCRLEDAVDVRWEPFLEGYLQERSIKDLDLCAVPLFVCARYLWHIGVHTQNTPDWGIGWLNNDYFNDHLNRLHQAEEDYLN